jgi:hypothetical protein
MRGPRVVGVCGLRFDLVLELAQTFVEPFAVERADVNLDDFGQLGGLGCGELACRDGGRNGCRRFDAVGRLLDRRQLHRDRLILDHRHEPLRAHANGRPIALHRQFDHLGRYTLGALGQQSLRENGCPIERPARPSGRVSAFAFLKRHGFNLLRMSGGMRNPPCAAAQQKTRCGMPPGPVGAVSVNTLFSKILVT